VADHEEVGDPEGSPIGVDVLDGADPGRQIGPYDIAEQSECVRFVIPGDSRPPRQPLVLHGPPSMFVVPGAGAGGPWPSRAKSNQNRVSDMPSSCRTRACPMEVDPRYRSQAGCCDAADAVPS
jgi:hypothetical protein